MGRNGATLDAIVVGGGPNGLTAAVALARAGRSVRLVEAADSVGGGSRTAELTLPGFRHDVCSAVHPLARASPAFRSLELERHGLTWLEPEVQLAHPLDDRPAALVVRDVDATAQCLGPDGQAYRRLLRPVVRDWELVVGELLGPFRIPRTPAKVARAARFGLDAVQPATLLWRRFRTPEARALVAGCAAHSFLRLNEPLSGGIGLVLLAAAHAVGWPVPEGGSGRIADALARVLREAGGEIVTGTRIGRLDELPPARAILLDLTPAGILAVAGERLDRGWRGRWYLGALRRFRYGPGVFKVDLALDGPVPWRDPAVGRALTVHLGGTAEEIAAAEAAVAGGRVPDRPFVLLAQPTIVDPSRAPAGKHVVWAYCHVPNGSPVDMTGRILDQIERFAPGTRDRILATATTGPADLERANPNAVGGDISGGRPDVLQFWTRPVPWPDPYRTPDPGILVCSSSTPPGAGVHGLCGWYAARSALRGVLRS